MTFWLLQTLGDVDPDLVERAAQPPRKAHPLRWVAAVAAAAVMVTGVGVWWHNRPEDNLPIINSDTPIGSTTDGDTPIGHLFHNHNHYHDYHRAYHHDHHQRWRWHRRR